MGKVSPVTTKYIIHSTINVEGLVDKPDVIGAIFGQTEGFLGQDLELRELQRAGKVGRIEVNLNNVNSRSTGNIIMPTSLDKAETAIIGAAIETIERIGPCNAKVKILKIEDVRVSKRGFVIARAKELLRELQTSIDSQELTEEVAQAVRVMEITEWGVERLPAGPGVNDSEEIIVVEGRADVLNLLKNGFKNTIALNGTSVPQTVKELCRQKTVTAFVDGDRGGDMILRELIDATEIDFITKAPAGKEVEELTKKEIHVALRAKIAAEQFRFEVNGSKKQQYNNLQKRNIKEVVKRDFPRREEQRTMQRQEPLEKGVKENFRGMLDDLVGTRGAYLIDESYNVLGKVPVSELETTLKGLKNVFAVVLDGAITREISKSAEENNVKFLIAANSNIRNEDVKIRILTSQDL